MKIAMAGVLKDPALLFYGSFLNISALIFYQISPLPLLDLQC